MPYKSAKQAAYMHINHPTIAAKWDRKYGSIKGMQDAAKPAKKPAKKGT